MKRFLYILILVLVSFQLEAQFKLNFNRKTKVDAPKVVAKKMKIVLKQANKQFSLLKYAYAIPLYKSYLKLGGKDSISYKQLGFSYRMVNQIDSALFYYSKANLAGMKTGNIIPELQAQLGKYENAKLNYAQLVAENKTTLNESRLRGFTKIDDYYEDSLDYTIYNTKFNTPYNDLNLVPLNAGYVFESNRINLNGRQKPNLNEYAWDGNPFYGLYYVTNANNIRVDSIRRALWKEKNIGLNTINDQSVNDVKKVSKSIDFNVKSFVNDTSIKLFSEWVGTKLNVSSVCFTQDFKTAYFTRNGRRHKRSYLLEIWEAKFFNDKWTATRKMFFNKKGYNYFHPTITPDGKRLYFISDEVGSFGGTDIYYTDKNQDGSWKKVQNAGSTVNTTGNELFPRIVDGNFYFSSNGHPGLGGLDIFKLVMNGRGDLVVKNIGYPLNSNNDDMCYSFNKNTGFFSSNRIGSDDILAFDYKMAYLTLKGVVKFTYKENATNKIFLTQINEVGKNIIVDSASIDSLGNYSISARPNKNFNLIVYNKIRNKIETSIRSNNYVKVDNEYVKQIDTIVFPLTREEILAQNNINNNKSIDTPEIDRYLAKTVDSLTKVTKNYFELHHVFNKVTIVQEDLNVYKELLERIKNISGREIVIVSATDCKGTNSYNERLSQRRARYLYNTISKLSKNKVIIKHVGERELIKACDDVKKSNDANVINRYSYVFIVK
jgi:outer membrane protein OmpA-like peptidoglycan-associated protein